MEDFLGNKIEVGMRAIRAESLGHYKKFVKGTVQKLNPEKEYGDGVGFLTDGNERIGWTYPHRIIVETSFGKTQQMFAGTENGSRRYVPAARFTVISGH